MQKDQLDVPIVMHATLEWYKLLNSASIDNGMQNRSISRLKTATVHSGQMVYRTHLTAEGVEGTPLHVRAKTAIEM